MATGQRLMRSGPGSSSAGSAEITRLDDALSIRHGHLFIEDVDTMELARRFGTPLYVTSGDQIVRNLSRLRDAFGSQWPGELQVLPSIKANSSLAVRRILTEADAGCDAFGEAELEAALRGGVAPARISLNGPTKGSALLERAVSLGVRVTLDSVDELERTVQVARHIGQRATVRLRLRPDYRSLLGPSELMPQMPSIREAASLYKAGIPTEDLLALDPDQLLCPELDVSGFMVHLGRHDAALATWRGMAEAFVALLRRLLTAWPDVIPREIDIGGGFPVPRDPFGRVDELVTEIAPRADPLESFAGAIVPILIDGLRGLSLDPSAITLEVEPGRSLFGDAGIHLATVRHVKRESVPFRRTWIETDTSDAWLADVILERNRWSTVLANRADASRTETTEVVGTTCAPDVIVSGERMPAAQPGDVLAVLDTGAYQEGSASNFNALPRPGTVLVYEGRTALIRRSETIDDVFAREVLPSWLAGQDGERKTAGWRVTGLDHVAVTSGDLERSLHFYCDVLGLSVREQGESSDGEISAVTGIPGARVRWADLLLPNRQVLELLHYVSPAGTPVAAAVNDPGATHISLRVEHIEAAHARLVEEGVPVQSAPISLDEPGDWNGARCFYALDPDGVTVELIEWAE